MRLLLMFLVLWLAGLVVATATGDAACSLQKRASTLPLQRDSDVRRASMHDLWSTPGLGFRQCPKQPQVEVEALQMASVASELMNLTEKPQCPPGEVLIGNFQQDSYEFSCCSGPQCQGCRSVDDGVCQECAAGYVLQTIPVLNQSKCFICDDVPGWHDMKGRSCTDLEKQGICNGAWPEKDLAYQGVKPSEACCACGGGSVYPTPVVMDFADKALYFGQEVDDTPQPMSEAQEVDSCNLASAGLHLLKDGRVQGVVSSNATTISCSTVFVQDPIRGIAVSMDFSVPVTRFSYGRQVVFFKSWGLDDLEAAEEVREPKYKAETPSMLQDLEVDPPEGYNLLELSELSNFKLLCNPTCPWLTITSEGELSVNSTETKKPFPEDMRSQVSKFSGMPSCSCEVSAATWDVSSHPNSPTLGTAITEVVAVQARLWKGGAWKVKNIVARNSMEITEVLFQEDLGPGLRWFDAHDLAVSVVEEISSGQKFVVSASVVPEILDVQCTAPDQTDLRWSRISGDVLVAGELAFNLDPATGTISGTPQLGLPATQGRAELNITCQVALGGPLYDKVLPLATLNIQILDDVCWVPSEISGTFLSLEFDWSPEECSTECRRRPDCAAFEWEKSHCRLMVSTEKGQKIEWNAKSSIQQVVRLNNCSEEHMSLNFSLTDVKYLDGMFAPVNVYRGEASYSRPGSNPERQLRLARRSHVRNVPTTDACENATWVLLHINASDFEDGNSKSPEFFGAVAGCIIADSAIIHDVFQTGQSNFEFELQTTELRSAYFKVPETQEGLLKLSVPSCPAPNQEAPNMMFGTVEQGDIYSLGACECFGEAHANIEPVDEGSNTAVPRNGVHFNNGTVADQLIFSGPYVCEQSAEIKHSEHLDLESCREACKANTQCRFYLFGKSSESCSLFSSCDYIQDLGLQLVNELYGIPPSDTSYCHIANPKKCWENIRRRSMLSFTPSILPECLFQKQHDACDALQLILGEQGGRCARCQYLEVNDTDPFAERGLQKLPLPSSFPSASQISVSCNDTSRMFARLQNGLQWEGPRSNAIFTCVSGEWVGEVGPWQYLSNFTCERCLQLGGPSLQRLSQVLPEIYFLEYRQVQVTYPFASPGCSSAAKFVAAPLVSLANKRYVIPGQKVQFSSSPSSAVWWTDNRSILRAVDNPKEWCLCQKGSELESRSCEDEDSCTPWVMERGIIQSIDGSKCVRAQELNWTVTDCPPVPTEATEEYLFYLESGNCVLGFDLTNTAEKLFSATLATAKPKVRLGNLAYYMEKVKKVEGFFHLFDKDKHYLYAHGTPLSSIMFPFRYVQLTIDSSRGDKAKFKFGEPDKNGVRQLFVYLPDEQDTRWSVETVYPFTFLKSVAMVAGLESVSTNNSWTVTVGADFQIVWSGSWSRSDSCCCMATWNPVIDDLPGVVVEDCEKGPGIFTRVNGIKSLWNLADVEVATTDQPIALNTCDVSLSVDTGTSNLNPNAEAQKLDLNIPSWDDLSTQEKTSYEHAPGIFILSHISKIDWSVVFACLPGQTAGTMPKSTSCISKTSMKMNDLLETSAIVDNNFETLFIEKTCASLISESTTVDPSKAIDTAAGGMSMKTFTHIMRSQNYYATSFGDASEPPFSYKGTKANFGSPVGFLSLQPGGAPWGLRCPKGAVLASQKPHMPYCLQIDADKEEILYAFSDSISCPAGMAVSGWYNLPGIPVSAGKSGGPSSPTGLRLFCRATPLLSSSCEQAATSYCQAGGVVVTVSFNSAHFKLGCCKLERRLGLGLTPQPRQHRIYEDFSGYFCPTSMDVTGALIYDKTEIPTLGEPNKPSSGFTLVWNRVKKAWELYKGKTIVASVPGEDDSPVRLNFSDSSFSVTYIQALTASWLTEPKPTQWSPFPKEQPKFPILQSFHADQPDYKEYCNPEILQDPSSFQGASIDETNPCYHTFNAKIADLDPESNPPLPKGVTEQAFWQCSERSKRRQYMKEKTISNREILNSKVGKIQNTMNNVMMGLDLAAAIVGMIPWGSYALPGMKGQEKVSTEVKDEVTDGVKSGYKLEFAHLFDAIQWNPTRLGQLEKTLKSVGKKVASRAKAFATSTLKNLGKDPWLLKGGAELASGSIKIDLSKKAAARKAAERKTPPIGGAALKNMSKILLDQTVPELSGDYGNDLDLLAEAGWKDCMPLQLGLSKVMCDLFCIDDAVRSGTTAVLSSLQDSHDTLMNNLQDLLDYQTQYLLWAIGTVLDPKKSERESHVSEILSGSSFLEDLRQMDVFHSDLPHLDREILEWHRSKGDELLSRVAALSINASMENWPHRTKSLRGMLQHFHNSFQKRLRKTSSTSAQKQMNDKLQLLRDQAAEHRSIAQAMKALRMQEVDFDLSNQVVWTSILESFLRSHEKHDTFTMLNMKALDQMEHAISLAQNFSRCAGADTAELREVWQLAQRSQERSSEALIEAWAASVMTSEHLEVAVKDQHFLEHLLENVGLGTADPSNKHCQNMTMLAQETYSRGVVSVASALQPLAIQLTTFKVLTTYQEKELQHRRLDYVPAPAVSASSHLQTLLQSISDPSEGLGHRLAVRALNFLGKQLCPAPEECEEGMLIPQSAGNFRAHGVVKCGLNHIMTKDVAHFLLKNLTLLPETVQPLLLL